ncbi:hypothetical protein T07_5996 [Trichinella nelsoni]|uniref:Uncharacterized protein n=1 Tax=Trichinella nelsoni TaxID=6336 RepID=A0A0V0RC73_9BILA|nr:hypothetical protein T07_5996 [Trichinella nelsoni]
MIAWHGIFLLLDGVSFSSRQPLGYISRNTIT